MLRLRVELGFASGRFMSRISSGWMGNLAHARILLYLSTSQEMVRKKELFKVREKSGNSTLRQGKFVFKRNKQKLDFFTNSSTLVSFYGHEM